MALAGLLLLPAAGAPEDAAAQERCALRVSAANANSVGAPGAYTTYLGGGTVTLSCGVAVMTGDSAVHFEAEGRAQMIGEVDYRDTTRTLSSDRLTYFERSGQVVATGDVELVRLSTGARLTGPRVSFFRAGSAGGRSLATGRPHVTVPPEQPTGETIEIDADTVEFIGDDAAFAWGDVEIQRTDFEATADSASLTPELGRLFGRPVITVGAMRLEGDSVHTTFVDGAIELLRAFGSARAQSEAVELEAEQILIEAGATDVERIRAFGTGRSIGAAESFIIAGDSLDFAFTAGEVDSVTAFGEARAFQLEPMEEARDSGVPLTEPPPVVAAGTSWIEGDSIRAWLEPAPADGAADRAGESSVQMRRLLAMGEARSFYSIVRDSTSTTRPSRNYLIGESIEIQFAAGEPERIVADQAIGVFLEPSDETSAAPADTSAAPADTSAARAGGPARSTDARAP